jgi:phage shock protein PspC (stress-responsive transcriptional regulator)
MKKTISINIAGVVFNIEEDAYAKLSQYLDAVKKYFSTYEGAEEISADIEGRIAEKFQTTLKENAKQVLNQDDVEKLIASMGTVADFEAIEEDEDLKKTVNAETINTATEPNTSQEAKEATNATTAAYSNKFIRDASRKAIGGVCSGLGHYFNIDAIWIRIIAIFLAISPSFLNGNRDGNFAGILILVYLALWMAFPEKHFEDNKAIKKFYRDTENKALFGVAGGLASYFNIDRSIVRLAFFIGIFMGGLGILLYFILWAVSPSANTLTQKMEMKGQALTISNIEQNVKQNNLIDTQSARQESTFSKITLFPFRIIASIFGFIGQIFRGLGPIVRVFSGILMTVIAACVLFALIMSFGVLMGIGQISNMVLFNVPMEFFTGDISPTLVIFGLLAVGLPFLMLGIAGLSLISNRKIIAGDNWGVLLGIWGASLGISGGLAGNYATNFSKDGKVETTKEFIIPAKILVLDARDNGDDKFRTETHIEIEGQNGSTIQAIIQKEATGRTNKEAEANAVAIQYNIMQNDSAIVFDREIGFAEKARFRHQSAKITLKIPYNKPFIMTSAFANTLNDGKAWRLTDIYDVHPNNDDRKASDWKKVIWVVKPDSGIVAVNLKRHESRHEEEHTDMPDDNASEEELDNQIARLGSGSFTTENVSDFEEVYVAGDFLVKIEEGSKFNVQIGGREKENIKVEKDGNRLKISQKKSDSPIGKIIITMPKINRFEGSGHVWAKVKGFDSNQLKLDLSGNSALKFDGKSTDLKAGLSGNSNLFLWGKGKAFNLDMSGSCYVESIHFETDEAIINASGDSKAKVNVISKLKGSTTGSSSINYLKKDNLKIESSGNVGLEDEDGE